MLSYTDLKKGVIFIYERDPYEVMECHFLRMQQRKAVVQSKIRNLRTGKILDRNWQASDEFEEADVEKKQAMFIYTSKDDYWFHEKGNPKNRFSLTAETIGDGAKFLKPNTEVVTTVFGDKVLTVILPIKMDFEVVEAPPALRGNTAQGGTKVITLDNGAKISTPLFVETGDMIRINTTTGEYVERVDKK